MNDRKRRLGRYRTGLSLAVAIVAAIAIAFVVLTRSRLLPYQVAKYVNRHLLVDTRFEFSCGGISGDLVKHVVIHNPVLRYHAPEASFNVFRADEIEIDYDAFGVFRLNLVVHELRLRNVGLQIRQDERGRLILPIPLETEEKGTVGAFSARADVRRFVIDGLRLNFGTGDRELAVRDVNLKGAIQYADGVGRLQIDTGSAYLQQSGTAVRSLELDVVHETNALRVRKFAARLDRSYVMANGAFRNGEFERLQLVFNPIVLEELHSLGLVPDLAGEMVGDVVLDGPAGSLSASGTATGTGFGLEMKELAFRFSLARDELRFQRVAGEVFDARLDGTLRYGWGRRKGFNYDGVVGDLDLAHGFLPNRGLPPTDFSGRCTLAFDGVRTYAIRAELDSAMFGGYESYGTFFAGEWEGASGLTIDEIRSTRPGYTIEGSGRIGRRGETEMVFSAFGNDLTYFWDYAALPRIAGEFSVGGKLSGPIHDLKINLNGAGRGLGYLFVGVDSAAVQAEVEGVGSDTVAARVDVTGRSVFLAGRRFASPHLRLDTGGGTTRVTDFSFSRGDTSVSMGFEITEGDDATDINFQHINVAVPGEVWRNERPAVLRVSSGALRLDSLVFAAPSGLVGVAGGYSERDGTCRIDGWAEDFELGLLREGLSMPIRLSGRCDASVHVEGALNSPRAVLDVRVGPGTVDSVQFDALHVNAGFSDGRYRLTRLAIAKGGDSLSASGWWDVGITPDSLLSDRSGIKAAFDRPFRLALDCTHFPVPSAMDAVHARTTVGGAFTGTVVFEGTPRDPDVTVRGVIDPRDGRGMRLPTTAIDLAHHRGRLEITEVSLGGGLNARVRGVVPVSLSMLHGPRLDRDARMDLGVTFDSSDLALLLPYAPWLSRLSGNLRGRVTVAGKVSDPDFSGRVELVDGTVRFTALDEAYTDVDAQLTFRDDSIDLVSIRGRSRGKDAFSGSGTVKFKGFRPSDYRADVTLQNFWIRRKPDYEALLDGTIAVRTHENPSDRRVPNITGRLKIEQAEIEYTFESAGAGRPSAITLPSASPKWICSIDLDADNNLWVRNPDMNIELAGNLILKRDAQGLYLRGELNALRGSYTLYNNKFTLIDGTLDFSAAEVARPEVSINAYTPYRVENGEERRIYLSLNWKRDQKEPEIQLSYDDPGYYESDLWRMLGGTDIAGGLAANTLEKLLNEQMSGITIHVDRQSTGRTSGGAPESEMVIGVGKYLWEDLYLTYRQGLTVTADQTVEVEYRLRNMIFLRSGIIRHSNPRYYGSILRSTDEYNLDVKFRWEY